MFSDETSNYIAIGNVLHSAINTANSQLNLLFFFGLFSIFLFIFADYESKIGSFVAYKNWSKHAHTNIPCDSIP